MQNCINDFIIFSTYCIAECVPVSKSTSEQYHCFLCWSGTCKMLDNCHSSCKCFVLLVGTHLIVLNAPEISPALHQVRSLKDAAARLFHVGWLPTHKIDFFAARWSEESCCLTVIISTLQCTTSKFWALSNPCNPKQWAFFFIAVTQSEFPSIIFTKSDGSFFKGLIGKNFVDDCFWLWLLL